MQKKLQLYFGLSNFPSPTKIRLRSAAGSLQYASHHFATKVFSIHGSATLILQFALSSLLKYA